MLHNLSSNLKGYKVVLLILLLYYQVDERKYTKFPFVALKKISTVILTIRCVISPKIKIMCTVYKYINEIMRIFVWFLMCRSSDMYIYSHIHGYHFDILERPYGKIWHQCHSFQSLQSPGIRINSPVSRGKDIV